MKIETKYNIGDEVWFIHGNRCSNGKICGMEHTYGIGKMFGKLYTGEEIVKIHYSVESPQYPFVLDFEEEKLFPTKEELLKSL